MADLDVQPKRATPVWLWLFITLVVIAILFSLIKSQNDRTSIMLTTDSTIVTTNTLSPNKL